ncbi:hypothetical protein L596_011534 [Steinernema carpocapsae]|uniref:Saposin B-type domain-containing protein n=1 Tax=Steinernema carpocapsae TaxID=34508 RepID=A0A4U5NU75_STECR|nr:hypothetical protein L596_011534 [Steinernema carpocapsae]
MRFFVILAALVAVSATLVMRPNKFDDISKRMECLLCEDIIKDSEEWLGEEGDANESKIEKKCQNFFGGDDNDLAKIVCDSLLANWLDKIVKHMEDPNSEKKDSKLACQQIGMCVA